MTAARHDLTIDQGADFSLELTIKESASVKNLTNWYPRAQLRKSKEASAPAATFSAAVTGAVTNGDITISLPFTTTRDLAAGVYYYDVELIETTHGDQGAASDADTLQVLRLLGGQATVRREVTR